MIQYNLFDHRNGFLDDQQVESRRERGYSCRETLKSIRVIRVSE